MSTQIRFDLAGLSRAIEEGDARYQLALYADDAEMIIIDADGSSESPQILHGKPAIRGWIEQGCTDDMTHRVRDPQASEAVVSLTEERRLGDGSTRTYACTAEVARGQIKRETVTLTNF